MKNAREIIPGENPQPVYQDELTLEIEDGNKVRIMPERGNKDKTLVFVTHGSFDEREYLAEEVSINGGPFIV